MRLSRFSPHSCNELSCSIRLFAGGRTPPPRRSNVPASKRNNVFASQSANLRTCQPSHLSPIYPLYFHRLAHSFALAKKNTTPLFSIVSALWVRKHRGRGYPLVRRSTIQRRLSRSEPVTSHESPVTSLAIRPIAANVLWCNNPDRHKESLRSGETTPLPPVSNNTERTSGTVRRRSRLHPDSIGVASRAWVHRSNVGP